MKKHCFIFSLLILLSIPLTAQTSFSQTQTIALPTTTGDAPYAIASADIDDDGFTDLVVGTQIGNSIFWYKNDGSGNFTLQTTITTTLPSVSDIVLVDVNGDDAIDIISNSFSDDKLVWFANDDTNLGSFGTEQVIATGLDGAGDIDAADLNGDTFVDIVLSVFYDGKVVWFAGDGTGSFGVENTIDNTLIQPGSIDVKDADADGDLDVIISTARNLNNIPGQDNSVIEMRLNTLAQNGMTTFTNDLFSVTTGKSYLFNVALHDIDNDGSTDLDVLSTDLYNNLSWYKRDDINMEYDETVIASSIANPAAIGFYDLDLSGDGLKDIILSSGSTGAGNDLVWYKNNGGGSFSSETVIDATQNQAYKFIVEDIDNDTDLDIVSIAYGDNDINVFKNERFVLAIDEFSIEDISIYPNPVLNQLVIKHDDSRALDITIYSILGDLVLVKTVYSNTSIDVSNLASGAYFIKIKGVDTTYKFIKE